MTTDDQVRKLVLDLFKNPSERDKQYKIGPSGIGDPCDYCVSNKLLGRGSTGVSRYWLGAKLGTAMHALLETEANNADTSTARFNVLAGGFTEGKVVIGDLGSYGIIKGSIDLYVEGRIIDYKSSLKHKTAKYKLDGVPQQYVIQQNLYAWGLNKEGEYPVDRISLAFVNRDGSGDNDVWIHSFNYDEGVAVAAWTRLESLWEFVSNDGDPETLESHPSCFNCNVNLHRF